MTLMRMEPGVFEVKVSRRDEYPMGMTGTAIYGMPQDGEPVLSEAAPYRYLLTRTWGAGTSLAVIGLNPSTATATLNDPTIGRCIRFANRWSHGSLIMANLYAYRATKPTALAHAEDPVGPLNDEAILEACERADRVLAAWGGAHKGVKDRVKHLFDTVITSPLLRAKFMALRLNADGHPGHPLYLPGELEPFEYHPWEA